MTDSPDDLPELAEGTSVRIDGTRSRVDRIVDHREEFAILVAVRSCKAVPERRASIEAPFGHIDDEIERMISGASYRVRETFAATQPRPPGVHRESHSRAFAALEVAIDGYSDGAGNPRRVVIHGPPGSGRRSIIDRFRQKHDGRGSTGSGSSIVPVAIVPRWKDAATDFYEKCLTAVGVPAKEIRARRLFAAGRTDADRRAVAIDAIHEAGVRMLVVKRLTERGDYRHVHPADIFRNRRRLKAIDDLADGLGSIAIVVVATTPLHGAEYPPQWRRARHVSIERCGLDDEFRAAVREFERHLPLRDPSGLDRVDMIERLHARSRGSLEALWPFLLRCVEEAQDVGKERIDHDVMDVVELTELNLYGLDAGLWWM